MRIKANMASVFFLALGFALSGCVSTQRYNELLSEKESLSLDKDKLATQNEDLRAVVAGLERERDTLADQVIVLREQLKDAESAATTGQAEVGTLRTQITEKDNQINALNSEIDKLEAEIEALKSRIVPTSGTEERTEKQPGA